MGIAPKLEQSCSTLPFFLKKLAEEKYIVLIERVGSVREKTKACFCHCDSIIEHKN